MKVLHVITGLNDGGAEGVLTRLCLHSKFKHVVISLMDEGKYGHTLKEGGVEVYCLGMKQGIISPKGFMKLVKIIKDQKPDCVQTWMYHADLLGGLASRLAGVRNVFWGVRHSNLEKGYSKRSTIMIAHVCALLSRWIPTKIICCANKAVSVHSKIGYSQSKLVIIPNGYDLKKFRPDPVARKKIREAFAISDDEFLIGKVGRLDPQKDHDNLIRALALLNEKNVSFRCVLVGRGLLNENNFIADKLIDTGLLNKFILTGPRNDIPDIMNSLDLHVLSSAYGEAFPNVVAEAMACGTPCISTDVGDAKEIIGDMKLCCSKKDPEKLAELIISMKNDWQNKSALWEKRQESCVRRISENFSVATMVSAFEKCWEGV